MAEATPTDLTRVFNASVTNRTDDVLVLQTHISATDGGTVLQISGGVVDADRELEVEDPGRTVEDQLAPGELRALLGHRGLFGRLRGQFWVFPGPQHRARVALVLQRPGGQVVVKSPWVELGIEEKAE